MATERKQSKIKSLKIHLLDMMSLFAQNKKVRMNVANTAYNEAFDLEIKSAIKRIEKEENAILTMRYPLCEPAMLHGFMGVKSYLLNFLYENDFCSEYDIDEVNRILDLYCKKRSYDDSISTYNIYTVIYLNALFCDYLKKDYGTLTLNEKDCELIESLLGVLNDESREEILFSCAKHLDKGNVAYNNKAFMKFLPMIHNACKKKTMAELLVIE